MSNIMRAVALSISLLFTAGLSEATSQELPAQIPSDSSVESTVKRLRAGLSPLRAGRILRQEQGPLSPAELDALADSIVVIAVEYKFDIDEPVEKKMFYPRLFMTAA